MKKKKVIVILGQTATGKSALAVRIALRLGSGQAQRGAEIISADSRQVYKGLDIGTGKILKDKKISKSYPPAGRAGKLKAISYFHKGIPHHLLNVANPKRKFTVAQYQKLANKKIEEIFSRGRTPIICGGTGLYIDSITKGIVFPEVPPNIKLRNELAKKTPEYLFRILQKIDPQRAKNIE